MSDTLFNKRICNTYPGVIKTCDNAALTVTPKPMTDGVGNIVPIDIGTSTICYGGTQDFSSATVIGITTAVAGLVSGAGTNSMVSAGSLGVLSTADGDCSVSIGSGAYNCCDRSISIGQGTTGLADCTIGMGFAATINGDSGIAIGNSSVVSTGCGISIGNGAQSGGNDSIGIGTSSNARCLNTISIGNLSEALSSNATVVGVSACVGPSSNSSTVIGQSATTLSASSLAAGLNTCVGTCATHSTVIGCGAFATSSLTGLGADSAIVIGNSAKICDGLGLNGSYRSIAIGYLATTTCHTAISIGSNTCSSGISSIAVGQNSISNNIQSLAIGVNSQSEAINSTAIGTSSCACSDNSIAIGHTAAVNVGATCGIAIGADACDAGSTNNIAIGASTRILNQASHTVVGYLACATATSTATAIFGATSKGVCNRSMAFGIQAESCAANSLALGSCVIASRANVTTTCELETCVAGCGLIVKTPDGLSSYRIAVDNSGNITTALA